MSVKFHNTTIYVDCESPLRLAKINALYILCEAVEFPWCFSFFFCLHEIEFTRDTCLHRILIFSSHDFVRIFHGYK